MYVYIITLVIKIFNMKGQLTFSFHTSVNLKLNHLFHQYLSIFIAA